MSDLISRIAAMLPGADVTLARRIVQEMREPAPSVVHAGAGRLKSRGEEYEVAARDCWRAMIDEALRG